MAKNATNKFQGKIDSYLTCIKEIIANEAVFYPVEKFQERLQEQNPYPHLILSSKGYRMCRINKEIKEEYDKNGIKDLARRSEVKALSNEGGTTHFTEETIHFTDNGNARINTTFRQAGYTFESKKYEICHIGKETTHSVKTFGAIPNLVYLPRWIASATDYSDEIIEFLLKKSYSLYSSIMKEYMQDFDVDKFFLLLCNGNETLLNTIQNDEDVKKYHWKNA